MTEHQAEFEGAKFSVWHAADNYVHLKWHKDVEVNVDDANAVLDAIVEVANGHRLPLLVDMSSMRKIERDAREVFSTTHAITRVALIVRTALSRTVGSFFVGLGNPENPTRLFTDEAEARQWLLDDG